MSSRLLCVVPTLLILTAGVVASAGQQHAQLTDQQIASHVEHRLIDQDIRGVTVTVRDRTVTLSGVTSLTVMRGESDQAVGEAVAAQLRRYVFFTIFDDVDI